MQVESGAKFWENFSLKTTLLLRFDHFCVASKELAANAIVLCLATASPASLATVPHSLHLIHAMLSECKLELENLLLF